MHSFLMEDWLSVAGASSATVTQDATGWLDLAAFQDVVFYVDCRSASPGGASYPTLAFETAPAKDDALFSAMVSTGLAAAAAPTVLTNLMLSSAVPLARYVRWKLTGPAAAWNATFRVHVVANSPGL